MDDLMSILPIVLSLVSAGVGFFSVFISYSSLRKKSRAQEKFEVNIANNILTDLGKQSSKEELDKPFSEINTADFSFNKEDIDKMLLILEEMNKGLEMQNSIIASSVHKQLILRDLLSAYRSLDAPDKNEIFTVLKTGSSLSVNRFLTRSLQSALDIISSRLSKA